MYCELSYRLTFIEPINFKVRYRPVLNLNI